MSFDCLYFISEYFVLEYGVFVLANILVVAFGVVEEIVWYFVICAYVTSEGVSSLKTEVEDCF